MKKKITIEIDCNKDHCGKCQCRYKAFCAIFKKGLDFNSRDFKRLAECKELTGDNKK